MTKSILIKSIILIITLCIVFSFKPKDEPKFREYIKSFDLIKSPLSVFYNCPLHPIVKNHNRYFDSLLFGINEFPIIVVRDTLATVSFLVYEINSDRHYGRLNLKTYDYSATLLESNAIDSEEEEDGADWAKIDTALNREEGICPFDSEFTLLSSNVLSRSDMEASLSEYLDDSGSPYIFRGASIRAKDTFNIYPFNKFYQKITYFDNGQIQKKINYLKGKKEGEWITYYENGKISLKENYVNGKKEGEYFEYNENGLMWLKENYVNGIKNGECIQYNDSGQISSKSNYINEEYHGEMIIYHEDGQIKQKGNWVNGLQNGEWISYHKNGKIESKGNWVNGLPNGEIIGYWENGQIKENGNYTNGNGEMITYYENGQIKQKGNWANGLQNGVWIEYYENGQIKGNVNFVNGKEVK